MAEWRVLFKNFFKDLTKFWTNPFLLRLSIYPLSIYETSLLRYDKTLLCPTSFRYFSSLLTNNCAAAKNPLPSINLDRPVSFSVFHKFLIFVWTMTCLKLLYIFIFCHHPSNQISYSIIWSPQHQITTRRITYIFYFQSKPLLFFLKKNTFYNLASAL